MQALELHPRVRRLALLGGESSGKTTLAQGLAAALGTVWVPEYGRELWEALRRTLTADELLAVARRQVALEEEFSPRATNWLVCDTTPLTTLQYCLFDHGQAPAELLELAHRPYALTVVCEPDFSFVQDGCRRDDGFRAEQHQWALAQLAAQGVAWVVVGGTPAQRVQRVLHHISVGPAPMSGA
jgi:HTH-type transcriptional regulator, transcriptional repressor of NAD biosynthesis genes